MEIEDASMDISMKSRIYSVVNWNKGCMLRSA